MDTKNLGRLVFLGILVIVTITSCTKESEKTVKKSNFTNAEETPAKVYMAYHEVLYKKGDIKTAYKYIADGVILPPLTMIQAIAPREVKITDEKIEENSAILTAIGVCSGDGTFREGTIKMINVDGKWKMLEQKWRVLNELPASIPKEDIDIAAVDILFVQKGKDMADLKVIVKNNGGINIPKLSYTFSINEAKEGGSLPAYLVGPGKEVAVDFRHAYSNYYKSYLRHKSVKKPFELKMVLVLDPEDKLKEFNEENNKIIKTFYIRD